jgi:hypothetical protein
MTTSIIPTPLIKYYEAAIQEGPCGPSEAIALITTARVDRDGEVVVPNGIELGNYRRNPIVQWGHAKGLPHEGDAGLPVGKNLWIKPSRDGYGLVAKHEFDLGHEFSAGICGKIKRGFLSCYSITFQPLEYGPPTREEIAKNPSWKDAKTIYRKTELIEYSVVAMPANVDAVTLAKRGKNVDDLNQGAESTETAEAETALESSLTPDDPDQFDPSSKAYTPPPDDDEDEEMVEDDEEADEDAFHRGDTVKCKAPHCKGHGMVVSIHKKGLVPDVEEDIFGSRDQPAAKVRMYKAVDGGHVPSTIHKGVLCKHLSKCDKLKAPPKKKAPEPEYLRREPTWTAAEKRAYMQAKQEGPEYMAMVEQRVTDLFESRILGMP